MAPLAATLVGLALAVTSCVATISPPANNTCWNPDAKFQVTGDRPCGDPKNGHSACCTDGAYCMEGGLCFDGWALYRSSCTDPTWNDPACASTCRAGNQGGAEMISVLHVVPNVFCCGLLGETNGTCYDSHGREAPNGFSMDFHPTIIGYANESYGNLMPWVQQNQLQPNLTTNNTAAPPPQTTPAPAQTPAPASGPSAAAVGAGVGVPFGLALLAALALVLWQRRRIATLHASLAAAETRAAAAYAHDASGMAWDGRRWVPAAGAWAERPPSVPPKEKRAEMSGFDRGRELAAGWQGQELPGNGVDGKFDRVR